MAETVIVVGAGASAHYGYPVGDRLINEIIQSIELRGANIYAWIADQHITIKGYRELKEKLDFHDPLSIDAFLTRVQGDENEHLINAGKTMILYEILKREDKDYLSRFNSNNKRNENWYRFLANKILAEFLEYGEIKTAIITFNYDVSLDYYLYTRFGEPGYLTQQQSKVLMQQISNNFFHVYGQVDKYIWQGGSRDNNEYANYNGYPAFIRANELKDNIFVIGEDRNELLDIKKSIEDHLYDAKRVFFLGFSFDEQNTELLGLKEFSINGQRQNCRLTFHYTNHTKESSAGAQITRKRVRAFRSHKFDEVRFSDDLINKIESTKTVYGALSYDFLL